MPLSSSAPSPASPAIRRSALDVRAISVPFDHTNGLTDISLSVARGERVVVVGASGAGKTSLLRAIAGLQRVSAGAIIINGRDVTTLPAERRGAVYLHQTPLLFPHLSVFENVAFPLRVRGAAPDRIAERVHAVLATVRMDGMADRAPRTLSGGQAHRVALARAIAAEPAVLLLDEPLSSLDPTLRDEVRETIVALRESATAPAILMVTHDWGDAVAVADRVVVLLDRQVAQTATPSQLFAEPASLAVARFVGTMNEIQGSVTADGAFHGPLGSARPSSGGPVRSTPGPAVAVFPPDAVRAVPAGGTVATVIAVRQRVGWVGADLRVGDATVTMRVDSLDPPTVGAQLAVVIDSRRIVVFPGSG